MMNSKAVSKLIFIILCIKKAAYQKWIIAVLNAFFFYLDLFDSILAVC